MDNERDNGSRIYKVATTLVAILLVKALDYGSKDPGFQSH